MSEGQSPGGTSVDSSGEGEPKSTVDYETHRKLLGEKKKTAERAAALEAELEKFREKERLREEEELSKQKNFEQLLKNRDEELNKLKSSLDRVETERVQARKIDSFLKTLGGGLDEKYWSLVDLEKIVFDPSTRQVDEMSVAKYVDDFKKNYPETLRRPAAPGMPSNAPSGSGTRLTLEEWKSLPLKERKARMKEVVNLK